MALLGSTRPMARALWAYGLYSVIEFAIWVAVLLYAFDIGGTGLAGLASVAQLVPAMLLVPILAGFGDRMERGAALRRSHAVLALTCAMTGLALASSAPTWMVITSAAITTIAVAVVRPLHFSVLPELARTPEELVGANATSSMLDGVALFVGPAIAGVVVAVTAPWVVLAGACGLAVIGTVLCTRLGATSAPAPDAGRTALRDAFGGLAALGRDWGAIVVLLVLGAKSVVDGSVEVLSVAFSDEVLDIGSGSAGLVLGAPGIGGLLGAAAAASLAMRRRLTPIVVLGGAIMGLGVVSVAFLGALGPVLAVLVLAGFGAAILIVSGRTLLQRSTDQRILARVFAAQEATTLLGLAIGAALAPALVRWLSARGAFVPLGVGIILLTAASTLALRRLDARSSRFPEEIALLSRIPFLALLPPYEMQRLAQNATWRDVTAGDVVVREGDVGTDYFIIENGSFQVLVGDVPRSHRLEAGTGFGEIALLHDVRRTATVVALEPARLLVVSGADFLDAVTGSTEGRSAATAAAQEHLLRDDR